MSFVRVPQYVQIPNIRLRLLLNFFLILVVALLAWRFVAAKQLRAESRIIGHVHMEVTGIEDADFQQEWADNMEQRFCTSPAQYDYWADVEGVDAHTSHVCPELCVEGYEDSGCTTGITTVVQTKSSQAFFPTRRYEEILSSASGTSSNIFYPGVESLHVIISFANFLPETSVITTKPKYRSSWFAESSETLPVIVLNKKKKSSRRFAAGEPIDLTLAQLLDLAGVSLEDQRSSAGYNYHPNATDRSGPRARVSGLQLMLYIQCFGYDKYGVGSEGEGRNCYLSVEETGLDWISMSDDGVVDERGTLYRDTYYGVLVQGSVDGTVRQLDLNSIWLNVAALIFLLRLPKKFLSHMTINFFGHISKIYSKVLYVPFSIMETCGSIAMRLMFYKHAFNSCAARSVEQKHKGIPEMELGSQLESMLVEGEFFLLEEDFSALEMFAFNAVAFGRKPPPDSKSKGIQAHLNLWFEKIFQDFKEEFFAGIRKKDVPESLTLDHFMCSALHNDDMTFDMMVELFSQRHNKNALERFFLPETLKVALLESARIAKIESINMFTPQGAVSSIELHFIDVKKAAHVVTVRQQPIGFAIHKSFLKGELRVSQVDPEGHGAMCGVKVGWLLVGMDGEMFSGKASEALAKLREKASHLPLESAEEARYREEMENHFRQAYHEEHNKRDDTVLSKLEARVDDLRTWTVRTRIGMAALHRAIRAPLMSVEFGDGATQNREAHEQIINKHATNVKMEVERLRALADEQGKRVADLQAQLEQLQEQQKGSEKGTSRLKQDHKDIATYLDILEHNSMMSRRGSNEGNLAKTALQENRDAIKRRILRRVVQLCRANGDKIPMQTVLDDPQIRELKNNVVHSVRRLVKDYPKLFLVEVETEYFGTGREVVTLLGEADSTPDKHSTMGRVKSQTGGSEGGTESWWTRSLALV